MPHQSNFILADGLPFPSSNLIGRRGRFSTLHKCLHLYYTPLFEKINLFMSKKEKNMLNAHDIATYLTESLNTIGAHDYPNDPWTFKLGAEIMENKGDADILGIVRTHSTNFAPVHGYIEGKYVFVVELLVPAPKTNSHYLTVKGIVDNLMKATQDSVVKLRDGRAILTFTGGVPSGYQIAYVSGETVPLTFTVSATYTESAVTSGDKVWLLDGEEIPFLTESVSVEKEGISRKVYDEAYDKILLTRQTKFYTFRIPYASAFYGKLQKEILQSESVEGEKHTLAYYDGAAFTEQEPYTATVRIYRSANSTSARPDGATYEITFSDVYKAENKPLRYYISLIDFPFDMQGDDTRYFGSVAEQTEYFEGKARASSAPFVEVDAPNLDNLVITQQVYKNPAGGETSQFDYVNKNYAVVKVVHTRGAGSTQYFYYFITDCRIGADGQMLVDLKMDTVQTYFFDPDITFSDCLIERAHLNRFENDPDHPGYVRFESAPTSKIFNAEDGLSFPKRLIHREQIVPRITGNDYIDGWFFVNVAYWVYIFIDPKANFSVYSMNPESSPTDIKDIKNNTYDYSNYGNVKYPIGMNGATNCICYPIYKNANLNGIARNSIICEIEYIDGKDTKFQIVPSYKGREYFEKLNEAIKSFYYIVKLSIIPPFDTLDTDDFEIDNNNNLVIQCLKTGSTEKYLVAYAHDKSAIISLDSMINMYPSGLFFGSYQHKNHINTGNSALSENKSIIKTDIVKEQEPILSFNPKLNGQNFKELIITASNGDTFTYDIQKLVIPNITFEYTEPITPEITKYYLRVKGNTGLYTEGTEYNYTGLVGSTDNGLAFANEVYSQFIANNKNFFMQSNIKIGTEFAGGVIGGTAKLIAKDPSGLSEMGGAAFNATLSVIDRALTVDNMKSAPSQMKNANGNVIFNLFATNDTQTVLGLYLEKHSALEGDLKTANDFMNIYGFTFGAVANVRDYVHIRKYHNYIKAQLQSINGNLSNSAREDLRRRFADGVRFWNGDSVEYKYENYELWLEN